MVSLHFVKSILNFGKTCNPKLNNMSFWKTLCKKTTHSWYKQVSFFFLIINLVLLTLHTLFEALESCGDFFLNNENAKKKWFFAFSLFIKNHEKALGPNTNYVWLTSRYWPVFLDRFTVNQNHKESINCAGRKIHNLCI